MGTKIKDRFLVELYDYPLGDKKEDRIGKVISCKTFSEEDLIQLAVARGTDIGASAMRATLEIISELAIEQITKGAIVHLGLAQFHVNVHGVFQGDAAKWDKEKHGLHVQANPIVKLKKAVESCEVEVRGMAPVQAGINSVTDLSSGQMNTVLTPGGGIHVLGSKIKIDGDSEVLGLYLLHQETKVETFVPKRSLALNSPSKLFFVAPADLKIGLYNLSVTTQFTSQGRFRKQARRYVFNGNLEVK
ncbi:DUF4469 domain-containing protein [Marinifilum sp. N1E240]|uniref:DUF4469 domain-containing protein n=1 Tax=Marinifilum sp. N1E240 TaxID=2608082 RepID=UPI00128B24B8|nr:DUF4469 domain-containing protein [Marinifilum sp. N1E240]MPQ46797.1 DUF4469 domain-containing protein [Marinifilum sp. N1E240]